jgi:hypothetical protein
VPPGAASGTLNYKENNLKVIAITDSCRLAHGLVPQNKFFRIHLTQQGPNWLGAAKQGGHMGPPLQKSLKI